MLSPCPAQESSSLAKISMPRTLACGPAGGRHTGSPDGATRRPARVRAESAPARPLPGVARRPMLSSSDRANQPCTTPPAVGALRARIFLLGLRARKFCLVATHNWSTWIGVKARRQSYGGSGTGSRCPSMTSRGLSRNTHSRFGKTIKSGGGLHPCDRRHRRGQRRLHRPRLNCSRGSRQSARGLEARVEGREGIPRSR
jgi:hypothetical protein